MADREAGSRPGEGWDALIVVDLQPDFMPGGALPVPGGDQVVEPIARLLERRLFSLALATQDWHPPGHLSFASSHPGKKPFETIHLHGAPQVLWPDHCVQGSPGAALHPGLPAAPLALILRKGMDPQVDSYSAFRSAPGPGGKRIPTGLSGFLRERGVQRVYLCGLARDYCVKWTALDAAAEGFQTFFLWDLTRPVDPGSGEAVRAELAEAGVEILDSSSLGS